MKNNTLILSGLALLVALGFIILVSSSSDTKNVGVVSSSPITAQNLSYDFGDIDIFGGKVSTTYILKNEGAEDVEIVSALTSCMCTEGEIDGLRFGMHKSSGKLVTIPAGSEKTLTAIYDPLAHGPNGIGPVKRELFLKTNSEVTPEIKVQFSANVIKSDT